MKAYRKAFFILARCRRTAYRQIGIPYLLSAASAAIFAVGCVSLVYRCVAPIMALMLQDVAPVVALSAVGLDFPGLIGTTIGALRFTLNLSMWLVICGLVVLPLALIGIGLVESALSQLMFDDSYVPIWVYVAAAAFSALGVLIFELTALYHRIVGLHYYNKR